MEDTTREHGPNDATLERDRRRFAAPAACAGYAVHDPKGRALGRVKGVYVNGGYEPEHAEVGLGLFGFRAALIPVQDVEVDDRRRILKLQ